MKKIFQRNKRTFWAFLLSFTLIFIHGCCDDSKPSRSKGPITQQESKRQFEVGDMIKAKVDGRVGQIGAIENQYGNDEKTVYWIRFDSDKPRMKLRQFEIEKTN